MLAIALLVKQAGDVGGAKLVGIAAELGQLGQPNFPGQDAAVGEARVGREDSLPRARGESREIPPGWPAGWRRGRCIGHAGAGVGESQVALRVPMGVSRWVVALLAKQRQALGGAVALQIIEARRDMGQPHLAVGMLGVGGHKGGQGGAGISLALQQIHRAGGEVQGALAGGHQQVFWPASARRRAAERPAMPPPIAMLSNFMAAPWWDWRCWRLAGRGARPPGGGRPLAKAEQPLVDPVGKFGFAQGIAPQHGRVPL